MKKLPTNDRLWMAAVSNELHARLVKDMKRRDIDNRSEYLRQVLAEAMGDEQLAASRRGRPPKEPPQE